MDGISRSRGWDKEIPHGVLPMEQLVLSDKWARNMDLSQQDWRKKGHVWYELAREHREQSFLLPPYT